MAGPRYYDLRDDVNFPGRWFLGGLFDALGREIDERVFTDGRPVEKTVPLWEGDPVVPALPLAFEIRNQGAAMDFTFSPFGAPVLSSRIGAALHQIAGADIQRIAVSIAGAQGAYEIHNVTSVVRCVDEARSRFGRWTEADGRPELVEDYRGICPLVISPEKAVGHQVFRLAGWKVVIVVSQQVKDLLESMEVTGVKFKCVTP